ncbi:MAG: hypothetical protein E7429_04705 [Ruminococcaceae bacterium]|nr:hypothetical protein [Oscillospiraceae bacterium]
MADILDFNAFRDPTEMDKASLLAYLEQLRAQIAALDEREPKNMNSEAYEEWGEQHEELEDLVDEVLDLLDEMD